MSQNKVKFRNIVSSLLDERASLAREELSRLEEYLPKILDTGKTISVTTRNPETKEKEVIEVEIPQLSEFIHGKAPIIDVHSRDGAGENIRYIIKDINPQNLNVLLQPTHTNSGSSIWVSPQELKRRIADMFIFYGDVFVKDKNKIITVTPEYERENQKRLQIIPGGGRRPKVSFHRSGNPQTKHASHNKSSGQYFAQKVKNNV